MSATDKLRRMLDERGVEWVDAGDGLTLIPVQTATNVAWDVNTWPSGKDMGDCLWVQNRHPLTPEQAIAATLDDAFTREECEASFVHGYSLGTLPVGSDPQWDENRQTVDEHMAELGWVRERTCRNIAADDSRDEFVCSECGYVVGAYEYGPDIGEHCKGCGAKVVAE